jgi:nucleotide-binding universal stress UspA family protein
MSQRSLEIVPYAAELAAAFESTVLVLHVLEGTLTQPAPEVREAAEAFRERGIRTEPLLGKGDPASQIIDLCRENGADLIAMTTHGRSGVSRWVLGSVTEKVLREARVPLLVVRGREKVTIVLGP